MYLPPWFINRWSEDARHQACAVYNAAKLWRFIAALWINHITSFFSHFQPPEPPKVTSVAKSVSNRTPKPAPTQMMVQVHQTMNQDGVIIFKRTEVPVEVILSKILITDCVNQCILWSLLRRMFRIIMVPVVPTILPKLMSIQAQVCEFDYAYFAVEKFYRIGSWLF